MFSRRRCNSRRVPYTPPKAPRPLMQTPLQPFKLHSEDTWTSTLGTRKPLLVRLPLVLTSVLAVNNKPVAQVCSQNPCLEVRNLLTQALPPPTLLTQGLRLHPPLHHSIIILVMNAPGSPDLETLFSLT